MENKNLLFIGGGVAVLGLLLFSNSANAADINDNILNNPLPNDGNLGSGPDIDKDGNINFKFLDPQNDLRGGVIVQDAYFDERLKKRMPVWRVNGKQFKSGDFLFEDFFYVTRKNAWLDRRGFAAYVAEQNPDKPGFFEKLFNGAVKIAGDIIEVIK